EFVGNPDGRPELYVNRGNPDLDPAIGHNFDLTAEYYTAQIGTLKVSGFYKIVEGLVGYETASGPQGIDGVILPHHPYFTDLPDDILIIGQRLINIDEDSTYWGLSLAIERQFASLPGWWGGFGFYGNFTYSRETYPGEDFIWYSRPVFDDSG